MSFEAFRRAVRDYKASQEGRQYSPYPADIDDPDPFESTITHAPATAPSVDDFCECETPRPGILRQSNRRSSGNRVSVISDYKVTLLQIFQV
jgi:hypothetical protein